MIIPANLKPIDLTRSPHPYRLFEAIGSFHNDEGGDQDKTRQQRILFNAINNYIKAAAAFSHSPEILKFIEFSLVFSDYNEALGKLTRAVVLTNAIREPLNRLCVVSFGWDNPTTIPNASNDISVCSFFGVDLTMGRGIPKTQDYKFGHFTAHVDNEMKLDKYAHAREIGDAFAVLGQGRTRSETLSITNEIFTNRFYMYKGISNWFFSLHRLRSRTQVEDVNIFFPVVQQLFDDINPQTTVFSNIFLIHCLPSFSQPVQQRLF